MKFVDDRPIADTETSVRKLLEIINATEADGTGRVLIGMVNAQFLKAGGDAEEFRAAIRAAVDRGYITIHPSGGYVSFTQAGADLFA